MLLDKSLLGDDGIKEVLIPDQMKILQDLANKKEKGLESQREASLFFGLKVVYCMPRSIPERTMKFKLEECLRLKKKIFLVLYVVSLLNSVPFLTLPV